MLPVSGWGMRGRSKRGYHSLPLFPDAAVQRLETVGKDGSGDWASTGLTLLHMGTLGPLLTAHVRARQAGMCSDGELGCLRGEQIQHTGLLGLCLVFGSRFPVFGSFPQHFSAVHSKHF